MRIALLDDERTELDLLSDYLTQMLSQNTLIDTFENGEDFFDSWRSGQYDLIFLDIYMKDLTGIDVARRIRLSDEMVQLVFCTTSNDFASESYEVGARYYLRKPFTAEKVTTMLERLEPASIERARTVTLSDGNELILHNIIYTDYSNHTAIIHSCKRGEILVRVTQRELEETLCNFPNFICCSKGIIVNLHAVETLHENTFHMKGHFFVPISRRRFKETIDTYNAFRFEQMRKEGE